MCSTTRQNIQQRLSHIPFELLPNTFQDAVSLALEIGVQYLWIDSLCIVQDDPEDVEREIAEMGDIYQFSHLTIAADCAHGPQGGLWPRDPQGWCNVDFTEHHVGSFKVIARRSSTPWKDTCDVESLFCAASLDEEHGLPRGHLLDRGWTFQELVLSPRLVHFTDTELIWRCNTMTECQCHMRVSIHSPRERFAALMDVDGRLRMLAGDWTSMINEYSSRKFTVPQDRLPALSGIAGKLTLRWGALEAGVHYNLAANELLWYPVSANNKYHEPAAAGSTMRSATSPSRLPSWSWATMNKRVAFADGLDPDNTFWRIAGERTIVPWHRGYSGPGTEYGVPITTARWLCVSSPVAHLDVGEPRNTKTPAASGNDLRCHFHLTIAREPSKDFSASQGERCWADNEISANLCLDAWEDWFSGCVPRSFVRTMDTSSRAPTSTATLATPLNAESDPSPTRSANPPSHLLLVAGLARPREGSSPPSTSLIVIGLILREVAPMRRVEVSTDLEGLGSSQAECAKVNAAENKLWERVGYFFDKFGTWEQWASRCREMEVILV